MSRYGRVFGNPFRFAYSGDCFLAGAIDLPRNRGTFFTRNPAYSLTMMLLPVISAGVSMPI